MAWRIAGWASRNLYGMEDGLEDIDLETYFKAVLLCASGDGFLAPEERAWTTGLAAVLGGPELADVIAAYELDGDLGTLFHGRQIASFARRALVYDAIRACAADGELREGEWEAVLALASLLGVGESDITAVKALYRDERVLDARRRTVLFPGEGPGPYREVGTDDAPERRAGARPLDRQARRKHT